MQVAPHDENQGIASADMRLTNSIRALVKAEGWTLMPQARRSHQREEDPDARGCGGQPKAHRPAVLQRVPTKTVAKEARSPRRVGKGLCCPEPSESCWA